MRSNGRRITGGYPMTQGQFKRCDIKEFNMMMYCRKKATVWSWIDEYDGRTTIVDLCTIHEKWLSRSEEDEYLDYDKWLVKYA